MRRRPSSPSTSSRLVSRAARPDVEAAEALDPRATVVRVHRAKLNEREGRLAEALLVYESILGDDPDPAIEARAFAVASRLGREESAARHFAAAERGKVVVVTGGSSAEAFQAAIPRANTWRHGKPRLGASALGTQRPTADRSGTGRTFAPERTRRNGCVPARDLALART